MDVKFSVGESATLTTKVTLPRLNWKNPRPHKVPDGQEAAKPTVYPVLSRANLELLAEQELKKELELPRTSLTNSLYVGMKDLKNLTKDWEEIQPLTQNEKVPEVTAEEEEQLIGSIFMVGKASTVGACQDFPVIN